eukprot:1856855-Rhodomonas_salina.2
MRLRKRIRRSGEAVRRGVSGGLDFADHGEARLEPRAAALLEEVNVVDERRRELQHRALYNPESEPGTGRAPRV